MLRTALQISLFLALTVPGFAEDWVATRLRGSAEQLVHGQWVTLERGAIVLDGHKVRTGADGRVDLTRGAELIQIEPGTQIELHEGAGKLTNVEMSSGVIIANVERRNVQHFSVQTPYLAAVVKGTIFRVTVGGGAATVEVDRGTVQVQDTLNDLVVEIVRGQEAHVSPGQPLEVSGAGTVAVFNFEGERVVNGTSDVPADHRGNPADGTSNGSPNPTGNGNAGNNGNGNNAGNNGNGNGNAGGNGTGNGNAGNNGNGNNAGNNGNGNGNAGGNGTGNGNAGNNGNGNNAGNNGNGNGNAGGNGTGNGNAGNNGNGNNAGNNGNGNGNAGGNGTGNGNAGNSGNGNNAGNNGNGNAGGNGTGNGNAGNNGNGDAGNDGNAGNNGNGNENAGNNGNGRRD